MKILVTGSEGLIGTALCKKLTELGHKVIRLDIVRKEEPGYVMGDIAYHETLERAFKGKPDVVYHLGAEVSRLSSELWASVTIHKNILGVYNVIDWCIKTKSKLIFAGTSEAYGDAYNKGVVKEDSARSYCNNIYALTKLMGEDLIKYYHKQHGLKAVIARIFMCYGNEQSCKFKSAVTRFIDDTIKGKPLIVHKGSGRAWCYIDDTVSGLITLMKDSGRDCETYNIGNPEYTMTEDLAKMIMKMVGYSNSEMKLIPQPNGMTMHKKADFSKMYDRFGWKAKTMLHEGLRWVVDWHIKNS